MARTNRPLTMHPNRLASYEVPAGADLITVTDGAGMQHYALANPKLYIPATDMISLHDVTYRYIFVPIEAVAMLDEIQYIE